MTSMEGPSPSSPDTLSAPTAVMDDSFEFDIAKSPIQSFTQLRTERSNVFARRQRLQSLRSTIETLPDTGDAGRRKGLGLWMIGEYARAKEVLAKFPDDDVASFTCGQCLISVGNWKEAAEVFERLSKKHPSAAEPLGCLLEARFETARAKSNDDEAAADDLEAALGKSPESFRESAFYHHLVGRVAEAREERQNAVDSYLRAREVDPSHRRNLFRLAYLLERCGLDEQALEVYESLTAMRPIDRSVMINLGTLYEDVGRDQDAAACFDAVRRSFPQDKRARLFLEDARQAMEMYYDEDMERKEDRLNQILRIPITDFELSVRARNCLNKMEINTLGDLVRKTETELLAYKNFGETSLNEIKEILVSKGLRLGMGREEAVASIELARRRYAGVENAEMMNKPLSDLELSIRARRTVEGLGCMTVGDIVQHSEEELLGMPNFGVTSLQELKNKLSELGLKLKAKK